MKKNYTYITIAVILLIVIPNTFFIVDETEQVIITQFGEPIREAIKSAGLHVKIPFIHKTHSFDKRLL